MATADLTDEGTTWSDGYDSIVMPDNYQSKRGGETLDVTGFTKPSIRARHPIIKQTSTGALKPMPLNAAGTAFASLPAGHTYYGILINSVLTKRPFAGICRRGVVNPVIVDVDAGVYDLAPILTALKAALPLIDFIGDNQ